MNLPKFIKDDERLFRLLLGDLFPSLELPVPEYGALQVRKSFEVGAQGVLEPTSLPGRLLTVLLGSRLRIQLQLQLVSLYVVVYIYIVDSSPAMMLFSRGEPVVSVAGWTLPGRRL